jgi:hypothetical protein
METQNITEEQTLELFELMADLQEAKKLEQSALLESLEAQKRLRQLNRATAHLSSEIDRIKEQVILKDCPYKKGQKFVVDTDDYDQIKITYVSAYGMQEIEIRFNGRRKLTKGWEGKTNYTTVEKLNSIIICEL